jgi:hypothetical protein
MQPTDCKTTKIGNSKNLTKITEENPLLLASTDQQDRTNKCFQEIFIEISTYRLSVYSLSIENSRDSRVYRSLP